MDFLRRLSPAYQASPSRAVGVVPSRFEASRVLSDPAAARVDGGDEPGAAMPESVLPGAFPSRLSKPPRSGRKETADSFVGFDPAPARAGGSAHAPRPSTNDIPAAIPETAPEPAAEGLAFQRSIAEPAVLPRFPHDAESPIEVSEATYRDPHDRDTAPAISPVSSPAARHTARSASSPLSEAVLSQRRSDVHGEAPVVHVTIGRVELVANVVATAPPRRPAAPRSASLPLSDYLRGTGNAAQGRAGGSRSGSGR